MSNRSWALIDGENLVCQKDNVEIFSVKGISKAFNNFNSLSNTEKFIFLYGLKQNIQDYKAGESTPATMEKRLKELKAGTGCKIRTSFEKRAGGVTLGTALSNAAGHKGAELTETEVTLITNAFNAMAE